MTPFCCREASPQPENQTWLPAGGQCWRSRAEKCGGYGEPGFPQQIKSSVKPFSFARDWIYDCFWGLKELEYRCSSLRVHGLAQLCDWPRLLLFLLITGDVKFKTEKMKVHLSFDYCLKKRARKNTNILIKHCLESYAKAHCTCKYMLDM